MSWSNQDWQYEMRDAAREASDREAASDAARDEAVERERIECAEADEDERFQLALNAVGGRSIEYVDDSWMKPAPFFGNVRVGGRRAA